MNQYRVSEDDFFPLIRSCVLIKIKSDDQVYSKANKSDHHYIIRINFRDFNLKSGLVIPVKEIKKIDLIVSEDYSYHTTVININLSNILELGELLSVMFNVGESIIINV